jgi:hypothetical protein
VIEPAGGDVFTDNLATVDGFKYSAECSVGGTDAVTSLFVTPPQGVTYQLDGQTLQIIGDTYGGHAVTNGTTHEIAQHAITDTWYVDSDQGSGARNSVVREFANPIILTGSNGAVQLIFFRMTEDATDNGGTAAHPRCALEGSIVPSG